MANGDYVFEHSCHLSLDTFFESSSPSVKQVDAGGKGGGRIGETLTNIVATNLIASWPPEWRPTATPNTRTNSSLFVYETLPYDDSPNVQGKD